MPSFRSPRSPAFPRRSLPAAAIIIAALVVGLQKWSGTTSSRQSDSTQQSAASSHSDNTKRVSATGRLDGNEPVNSQVERVVDGDTILLADSKERVRLIGVNTPETVKPNSPVEPWGPEASQFTKQFLAAGKVRLEFDGAHRDKYGRLLAFVWVGDRMLNEELLRAGLARLELQYRYSAAMKARLQQAENEAKAARRGIWSKKTASP